MSGRAVGGVGAGCAGFSLVSILVGVGLMVWLGSQVLDATDPTPSPSSAEEDSAVTLTVEPATGLVDGTQVQATVTGVALVPVDLLPCVRPPSATEPRRCDEARTVAAPPGPDLLPRATVEVSRFIVVDGSEVDCAQAPETCALVAATPDDPMAAVAPLSFEPG